MQGPRQLSGGQEQRVAIACATSVYADGGAPVPPVPPKNPPPKKVTVQVVESVARVPVVRQHPSCRRFVHSLTRYQKLKFGRCRGDCLYVAARMFRVEVWRLISRQPELLMTGVQANGLSLPDQLSPHVRREINFST